jgi:hypothetical protein
MREVEDGRLGKGNTDTQFYSVLSTLDPEGGALKIKPTDRHRYRKTISGSPMSA